MALNSVYPQIVKVSSLLVITKTINFEQAVLRGSTDYLYILIKDYKLQCFLSQLPFLHCKSIHSVLQKQTNRQKTEFCIYKYVIGLVLANFLYM